MIEKIYNTVFEADSAYLSNLGDEGTYHSEFEVRLKTLELLGGDMTKKYTLLYEIECAILDIMGGDSTLCTNLYEARKEIAILQGVDITNLNTVYLLANAGADILPVTGSNYVTFTAEQANSTIDLASLNPNQTLEYSTDTTNWNTMNTSTSISLPNVGDEVYVRGVINGDIMVEYITQFKMSGKIAASGNCNAIWNYKDLEAPLKKYCGYQLFKGCTSLTKAPELPATVLADDCYCNMFNGCTSLTAAPELPATTLAYGCYSGMFFDCTSLTTAPELPATTLAHSCYYSMFYNCKSLTTAPELPAMTLAQSCYYQMFCNCWSLMRTPELPATTLAYGCYESMFSGCRNVYNAPELPATTLAYSCYESMFSGTSIQDVPYLPATTLAERCYSFMFSDCINIYNVYSEALPATVLAEGCYNSMFYACHNLLTAPKLPATELADYCYYSMFNECWNLQTAPELPATELASYCYGNMFYDCHALATSPELPATTLAWGCYQYMFYNCWNLTQITCLATDIPFSVSECLADWTYNVSSSGEFIKAKNMNDWETCSSNGIPCNWNVSDYINYFYIEQFDNNDRAYFMGLDITDTSGIEIKYLDYYDECNNTESDWMNYSDWGGDTTSWTKVYFRYVGDGSLSSLRQRWGDEPGKLLNFIYGKYNVGGDIHTLMFNYNEDISEITENQAFHGLFKNDDKLVDASKLVLPAKTISYKCYWQMFMECSSLTKGPIIEATECSDGSLNEMFRNCGGLTQITCYYNANSLQYTYSENWVSGVGSNGVFYGDLTYGLQYGDSNVPYDWETVNIVSDN